MPVIDPQNSEKMPMHNHGGAPQKAPAIRDHDDAVEVLKESADRYLRILEITKEEFMFYRHDVNGRFTYVSPSYAKILGYQPEEYIGKTVDELWSQNPINKEAARKTTLGAMGIRQPPYELEILHKNGACRRFVVIEAPVFDQDGQVVAVEGIARDITEKRHNEEQLEKYRKHLEDLVQQRTAELQASEKQLHDIIDFLPDPTYVIDGNESVIAWNRAMVEMTGISEKQAIGRPYSDCVQWIYSGTDPLLMDAVRRSQGKQVGDGSDAWPAQPAHPGISRQGNTFVCTHFNPHFRGGQGGYMWITTAPILDKAQKVVGVIESIRDITPIKEAEFKLQESERRLTTLLGNLPGMAYRVVQKGKDWVIEFVSEGCRQIFGYEPSTFVGHGIHEFIPLVHSEDLARLSDKVARALQDKKPAHCEYRIVMASGEPKWVFDRMEVTHFGSQGMCVEGFLADFTIYKTEQERLKSENLLLRATIRDRYKFKNIIGNCKVMQDIYGMITQAATSDDNVYISGESGTGKELVAQAIHAESKRKTHPFVVVNCAAIPENLIESEFFGTSKGAFTGATTEKKGFLEAADKGTLFLDEIGDISPSLQVKLLRAIDGGGFTPLGSRRVVHPDIRIITASNKDLEQLVENGKMRQDFFFRIHVIPIQLPPLRERGDDLLILINHFLRMYSAKEDLTTFTQDELNILKHHHWPGNVRELQNVLKRYLALRNLNFLRPAQAVSESRALPAPKAVAASATADHRSLKDNLIDYQKEYMLQILSDAKWNKTKAAKMMGISRKTLFRKMKACGL